MDHIYTVHKSNVPTIRVPLVINDRFQPDDGDFYLYPFRVGMVEDPEKISIDNMKLASTPIDELAPFLQAWLFFGLLHGVFKNLIKSDYEPSEFTDTAEDGTLIITTERLPL